MSTKMCSTNIKYVFLLLFHLIFREISASSWSRNNFRILDDVNEFHYNFGQNISLVEKKLSPDCLKQVTHINHLLQNEDKPLWLMRMLDSSAKFQPGILDGNLYNLGSYSECLSVNSGILQKNVQIKGKYCLINMNLNGTIKNIPKILTFWSGTLPMRWAFCMPDKCTNLDLEFIKNSTKLKEYKIVSFKDAKCRTTDSDNQPFDTGDIIYITVILLIFVLVILATALDYYISDADKDEILIRCFSVISNGKILFSTKNSSDQLRCMFGLRSLSMMWVILAHLFLYKGEGPIFNAAFINEFSRTGPMFVRGASVAVDTFFLMSGITMMYIHLKDSQSAERKFNIILYYMHRYLRLTVPLLPVFFFHITLAKHIANGPFGYFLISKLVEPCREYWWSVFLYVQNVVNPDNLCMGHTWHLSVEHQIFLCSPLILIPLKRSKNATLLVIVLFTCASMCYTFTVMFINEINDPNADKNHYPIYMKQYYYLPHTRAPPWLIGCFIGFFIYEYKFLRKPFKINKVLNLVLWALSVVVLYKILFHDTAKQEYNRISTSFFITIARPAWAVAVGWIIFSCVMGYGGLINTFLSLPIFHVLAKLSYSMFVTHFTLVVTFAFSQSEPRWTSTLSTCFEFFSLYSALIVISIIWTLTFELPLVFIQEKIFNKFRKSEKQEVKMTEVKFKSS